MTPGLACPADLLELMQGFVAEHARSGLRHDVRNKLASLRNAAYYIRRRLETQTQLLQSDPRMDSFLTLLDEEPARLSEVLGAPPPIVGQPSCAVRAVIEELLASLAWPQGTSCGVEGPVATVRAEPRELKLALFCLLEGAVRSGAGTLRFTVVPDGSGHVALRLDQQAIEGVSLRVARMVAERWGGRLDAGPHESSVVLGEVRA